MQPRYNINMIYAVTDVIISILIGTNIRNCILQLAKRCLCNL